MEKILGACPHDCPDTCSLITTVENGRAIKVQGNPAHPHTAGVLCTKVSRYTDRTYHPDRILHPLKRIGPKGSGQFVPISWNAALAEIAARLKAIAARNPQAILPYSYAGTMGLVQGEGMAQRFFNRLGASELKRTICASAGGAALTYTLGGKIGMQVDAFADARLILIWGSNSVGSNLHFWRYAQAAKKQGAKLICIDPRKSETADKCDEHIAVLPGTDAALALAMMHELIANNWLDHDYIAQHTLGWDALAERARQWSPERAAEVCGITAATIRALARSYGETARRGEPVAIRLNYGMQRTRGGGNAVRAICCLPALVGAWRYRAGGILLSSSGAHTIDSDALNQPQLRASPARQINMSTIGDALLSADPAIEAMIVYNSNPLAVAPESAKVAKGLAREDLFTVVLEHFQTDTADYADYILPATTQLEHWDIHRSYGHTDILLNRPALAPQGEAKPNSQIFRELAQHMGFSEPCFADSDEDLIHQAFSGKNGSTCVDFAALYAQGFVRPAQADTPFAHGGFPTPSGRCEFYSQRLADQGLDPLPDYLPNYEQPGQDRRFPLAFISPPARNFLNSSFANVQSLRQIEGEQRLEIHPDDAAGRQIADGDTVTVFNERGSFDCIARVNERARPGVVVGLGIWWRKQGLNGRNVNEVTSQLLTDLGEAPVFYDCVVEVRKAG